MFFCAISGSPPTVPVVSKTSGAVYEKALIERYIEENGTDPISGEPLTKEDLVDVKAKPSTIPPRPANQTSIPALLTALQSEYDSIMLESLEIKKAFQSSRQELANALYREDAATRVIARLMKERDEARQALSSIQSTIGFQPPAAAEEPATADVEMAQEGALPAEVEAKVMETNQALSSVRKKRKPAPGYKKADDIKSYTQINHVPSLHATKPAGITALDLAQDGNTVVTGGADKAVQVFDLEASKVLGTLKGHTKAVTHVAFREHEGEPRLAISASADKTVRVWGEDDGKWGARATLSGHKGEINGLAVHPSGSYVAAGSADSTWSLYDLSTAKEITKYSAIPGIDGSFAYTSFAVHPDGVLHGGGTKDGAVRVWDARQSNSLAATLSSHAKDLSTLSFSENGYYLATSSVSGPPTVKIFDLRKLDILSSWTLPEENTIREVKFDPSAQFLSVVGTDARVYANKTWAELVTFEENAGDLVGARFGKLGSEIVLAGMDRTLRVLGKKE
ncbi:pre-mRNA-processing factor 19 [Cryptococcus neoformans Bt1]|nr:pre-mRNA-processing factor 19 [Cryptococcus neoformans var. grubii Bt1]OXG15146.1 pre-mRNA-processing factor 19 [Cryptococcus neoformans var. grubii Ze90-1]OXG34496.1 pre-mRNA-processing factor 19 [Cryptococcus neoformans var. grubii Bt120]